MENVKIFKEANFFQKKMLLLFYCYKKGKL